MYLGHKIPLRIQSFNKGQYSGFEPTVVPEGAASELKNVLINKLGQCQQRGGLSRQGDNPDTLVSHWKFDASSSVDDKGSNDGTAYNVTYVDGKFGKCANFNDIDSNITVPADTTIDVNTIGSMSISAWIYVDTDGENSVGRIIDKTDDRASPTKGYSFNVQGESSSTVKLRFFVKYDGAADAEVVTSTTLSTGAWHKVVAVLQADDSADIFIDGSIAAYETDTSGVGSPVDDSAVDLVIGNANSDDANFDGKIDDVRIYNAPLSTASLAITKCFGLTRFRVPGTIDRIYAIFSGTLWRLDDDFKGYTSIDAGFTASKETNFVTGRASDGTYRLFILNATDNVHSMKTDESITDEGNTNADPPLSSQGDWHDNRLFLIDSVGDINFSDILDGQTFDRAVNKFRSKNPAKTIKSFKNKELTIYRTKGIEILSTDGANPLLEWQKTVLNEDIEFDSPRTVCNTGNDQIFLAKDGVRLLSRTTYDKIQAGIISQPIQDIIDDINKDEISKACAWFVNNRYVLAVPTGTNTENDTVIIWDSLAARISGDLNSGWTVIPSDDWNIAVFSEMDFSDDKVSLVAGDNRALSLIYQALEGNTDNGKTIESIVIGVDHTIDRVTDAIWDPLHIVCHSGVNTTVNVELELNRKGFNDVGTISLTGSAPTLPVTLPFTLGGTEQARKLFRTKGLGRGRTARVKLSHDTYNLNPTYVEYTLYARGLSQRVI